MFKLKLPGDSLLNRCQIEWQNFVREQVKIHKSKNTSERWGGEFANNSLNFALEKYNAVYSYDNSIVEFETEEDYLVFRLKYG